MNLIFLDVDGVLCTYRSCFSSNKSNSEACFTIWDKSSAGLIHNICDKHDFRIVISSTWRTPHPMDFYGFIGNDSILKTRLIEHDLLKFVYTYAWRTPTWPFEGKFDDIGVRGKEIKQYLEDLNQPVNSYIILDDMESFLDEQESHLCRTDYYEGFGYKNYEEVCDYINVIKKHPKSSYSLQGNSKHKIANRYGT